jgi:hypothetical protein
MANPFEFDVVAVDRYSKTLADVNKKAGKTASDVGRQFSNIGGDLKLDKVAAGFERLGAGAAKIGDRLGLALGPLTELGGVIGAGTLTGGLAAIGAAMAALTDRAARLQFGVKRTSEALGMSTEEVQKWRGAGEQLKIPEGAVESSLRGIRDTIYAARSGDGTAASVLDTLGIKPKWKANGQLDIGDAGSSAARAFSRISDPYQRALVARSLGVDEAAIPLFSAGPGEIQRLGSKTAANGGVSTKEHIDAAEKYEKAKANFGQAIGGVQTDIGNLGMRPATDMMDTWSDWLSGKKTPADPDPVDVMLSPVKWMWDMGQAAWGAPEPTTPDQRRGSGKVTDAAGNASPLMGKQSLAPIDVDPQDWYWATKAPDAMKGPLSGDNAALAAQVNVHVKVEAAPGTKASATVTSPFVPTRISYTSPGGEQ